MTPHLFGLAEARLNLVVLCRKVILELSSSPTPPPIDLSEALKIAIAHHQDGRLPQAETIYRQILQQQPNHPDALTLMGVIACQKGNLEEGIHLYRQALSIRHDHRQAWENLNLALWKRGKELIEEAIANYSLYANLQPGNVFANNALGNIYYDQNQLDQALLYYHEALQGNPKDSDTLNRIGVILQQQKKLPLAQHFHEQAIAHNPNDVDALVSLAKAYLDYGDLTKALLYLNRALGLNPNHAIARYNRALVLLQQGKFQEGFVEYEWRLKTSEFPPCPFKQPMWDGSDLQGKTLLLHAEQGLGDTIQFIRYAAIAAQKNGRLIFTCHRPLIRLMQGLPEIVEFIPLGTPLPDFDTYTPLLSLPRILGTTIDNVPNQVPYLKPPSSEFQLPPSSVKNPRLKVGIVWSGGILYKHNQTRSCSLNEFRPLLDVPEIAFYSLQKGIPQIEIHQLGFSDRLQDLNESLNDMADTANAIAQLDLVITVDTSVAHLAGALAKPVWVLLAHIADWRWMVNQENTPWYPTMRLFRQTTSGDWRGLMEQVVKALEEL